MFGQIAPTEYDLRFSLFGIPIRVHPIFWLTSAVLAWDRNAGDLQKTLIRMLCIFVAILVHELGHALVTRRFGWNSEIVLYFFGGYATSMRHSTWKDIAVSAAGPGAGFLLFFTFLTIPLTMSHLSWLNNKLVSDAIRFSLIINLVWSIFNLAPVLPLDGGQISRELCCWFSPRNGLKACAIISLVTAGCFALLGLYFGQPFVAMMFAYLAFQSYQSLPSMRRRYW